MTTAPFLLFSLWLIENCDRREWWRCTRKQLFSCSTPHVFLLFGCIINQSCGRMVSHQLGARWKVMRPQGHYHFSSAFCVFTSSNTHCGKTEIGKRTISREKYKLLSEEMADLYILRAVTYGRVFFCAEANFRLFLAATERK